MWNPLSIFSPSNADRAGRLWLEYTEQKERAARLSGKRRARAAARAEAALASMQAIRDSGRSVFPLDLFVARQHAT